MFLENQIKYYTNTERVELLKAGKEYFDVFKTLIRRARSVIHLQTYIFESDQTGLDIIAELIESAKRGVQVYLIIDAFGSSGFNEEIVHSTGIHFRWFSPIWSNNKFGVGRRLHHKVLVIDEQYAVIGGINIGDRYRGTENTPAWLDFAVLLEGKAVKEAGKICESIWEGKYFNNKKKHRHAFPIVVDNILKEKYWVRICQHDWARNKNQILKSYLYGIQHAKERIIIIASYFLPGEKIRRRLKAARRRGVDIKIILTQQSDVKLVKYAENYLYRWMSDNHISIYEWKPSVLHGKAMIVDRNWITVGSFNLNNTSIHGNIELNVDIINENFVKYFEGQIDSLIEKDCIRITDSELVHRNTLIKRVVDFVSYGLIRFLLNISLFLVNREKGGRLKYL